MAEGAGQIQEFVTVLKRRRWQIVLPALFVFVFGSAFAVIVPKKYVVMTRIEVLETHNPWDSDQRLRGDGLTKSEMPNVRDHVINYKRIDDLVGGPLIERWDDYKRGDQEERDEIVDGIMDNLHVEEIPKVKNTGSTYFEITYKDVDARRAEEFLEKLNRAWIEDIVARQVATYQDQRDVLSSAVKAAEQKRQEAAGKHFELAKELQIDPMLPPDARNSFGEGLNNIDHSILNQLRRDHVRAEGYEAGMIARRDTLEQQYAEEPSIVVTRVAREGRDFDAEIAKLERDIERAKETLETITPLNKAYDTTLEEIDRMEKQIETLKAKETKDAYFDREEPNPHKEELRIQLDDARMEVVRAGRELQRLEDKIDEYEGLVDRKAQDQALLANLYFEMNAAQNEAAETRDNLRDLENAIALFTDTADNLYEVSQPPVASDGESEPSMLLLIGFSLFAGLALGLALAILAEYGRNSYRTVSDLALVMTVPVLGVLDGIQTTAERRVAGTRRLVIGVSSAIILSGVAYVTLLFASDREKLPVSVVEAIEDFQQLMM